MSVAIIMLVILGICMFIPGFFEGITGEEPKPRKKSSRKVKQRH